VNHLVCVLQCVNSADLQDLANSAERTAQAVQQNITNAGIKAENIIKSANAQASQLIGSTLTAIQQMAQDVGNKIKSLVQAGRNFQTCVSEQSEAVRRIVPVAGMTANLIMYRPRLRRLIGQSRRYLRHHSKVTVFSFQFDPMR
jgi:vacuolar-type H+-ATPase subunit H